MEARADVLTSVRSLLTLHPPHHRRSMFSSSTSTEHQSFSAGSASTSRFSQSARPTAPPRQFCCAGRLCGSSLSHAPWLTFSENGCLPGARLGGGRRRTIWAGEVSSRPLQPPRRLGLLSLPTPNRLRRGTRGLPEGTVLMLGRSMASLPPHQRSTSSLSCVSPAISVAVPILCGALPS